MAFGIDDAVAAVAGIGGKLIDRLWPDPTQAAAAKLELLKMRQTGELATLAAETDLLKGQLAVNEAEASSGSIFVAGWRPMVGWTMAAGIAMNLIVNPLMVWGTELAGYTIAPPSMDMVTILTLLPGMLGMSLRTVEKLSGGTNTNTGH